jgi:hypothetical protein
MFQKLYKVVLVLLIPGCVLPLRSFSQISLTGQLRTRSELRDGVGTLNPVNASSAFFTSQRTRLTFGYKWDRLNFNASVQDVRVWGQDASTISNADGNRLMLHEGWAEIFLLNSKDTTIRAKWLNNLSFKIGRQVLNYDDARLLGELDWAQQARRHDAAVLKAFHKGWLLDLGAGFNQNNDAFGITGTKYVAGNVPQYVTNSTGTLVVSPSGMIPLAPNGSVSANSSKSGKPVLVNAVSTNGLNQEYKAMQFVYLSKTIGKAKLSGLFFKDDFSKYRLDSVGSESNGYVYGRRYDQNGVNSRLTYGALLSGSVGDNLKAIYSVGGYFQNGKDKEGVALNAKHYTASILLQKGKFSFGPGYDYLSGDKPSVSPSRTRRFDPLYPTAHKFWGYMDYFYVGTGSPAGGLKNAYFKTKYSSNRFAIACDIHHFELAQNMLNTGLPGNPEIKTKLGNEVDLVANYSLNKFIMLEMGYSFMAATNSLEYIKKGTISEADHIPQWAYLSINIKPDFFERSSSKK